MPKGGWPTISVKMDREEIPLRSMAPTKVPDEKWRYIDTQGHGHFWEGSDLPTLKWVVTGKTWVGDEYDGYEIEIGEYRCHLCAEVVEPRKRVTYEPPALGPATFIVAVDGEDFVLSEDQWIRAVGQWEETIREIATQREP